MRQAEELVQQFDGELNGYRLTVYTSWGHVTIYWDEYTKEEAEKKLNETTTPIN